MSEMFIYVYSLKCIIPKPPPPTNKGRDYVIMLIDYYYIHGPKELSRNLALNRCNSIVCIFVSGKEAGVLARQGCVFGTGPV